MILEPEDQAFLQQLVDDYAFNKWCEKTADVRYRHDFRTNQHEVSFIAFHYQTATRYRFIKDGCDGFCNGGASDGHILQPQQAH